MANFVTISVELREMKINQEKIIDLLEKIIIKDSDVIEKASAKIISDITEAIQNNTCNTKIPDLIKIIEKPKTSNYKGLTRFSPPNLGSPEPKMEKLKDKQVLIYPLKSNEKQDLSFNFKGKE